MYIRNPGHMTKMAAMPLYGINPSCPAELESPEYALTLLNGSSADACPVFLAHLSRLTR